MSQLNQNKYMDQKFIALLLILTGTILLLGFGLVPAEVFQSVILWGFAIFAGSDAINTGSEQFKGFMIQKERGIMQRGKGS